jgi:hypothetical protein
MIGEPACSQSLICQVDLPAVDLRQADLTETELNHMPTSRLPHQYAFSEERAAGRAGLDRRIFVPEVTLYPAGQPGRRGWLVERQRGVMTTEAQTVPEIREAYFAYTPPFDVAAVVRDLLSYVPAEYRHGLKCLVLLNVSGFSRKDRRRSIPSRGRRQRPPRILGVYHRPLPGRPAYIVIHVDRIIARAARLGLRVSIYRDSLFSRILYHEIGHHIHLALHPEHREPEAVADAWAERLRTEMFRQKYRSLTADDWKRVREVTAKVEQRQTRQR